MKTPIHWKKLTALFFICIVSANLQVDSGVSDNLADVEVFVFGGVAEPKQITPLIQSVFQGERPIFPALGADGKVTVNFSLKRWRDPKLGLIKNVNLNIPNVAYTAEATSKQRTPTEALPFFTIHSWFETQEAADFFGKQWGTKASTAKIETIQENGQVVGIVMSEQSAGTAAPFLRIHGVKDGNWRAGAIVSSYLRITQDGRVAPATTYSRSDATRRKLDLTTIPEADRKKMLSLVPNKSVTWDFTQATFLPTYQLLGVNYLEIRGQFEKLSALQQDTSLQ